MQWRQNEETSQLPNHLSAWNVGFPFRTLTPRTAGKADDKVGSKRGSEVHIIEKRHPFWYTILFVVHSEQDSLIRIFTECTLNSQSCKVSSCGQRWLWSEWAYAQADLSLRRVHITQGTIVDSRYLEFQGTLWDTSRYPYLDISYLQNLGKNYPNIHI